MFTRTVKSNACSFNNIHPFNYLNATESDLQVFSGVFSGGGGGPLASCFFFISMWACKSWNTKKYLLNGSCNVTEKFSIFTN